MAHCPLEGDLQLWESSREHLVSTFLPLHTPPPPAHTHTHTLLSFNDYAYRTAGFQAL